MPHGIDDHLMASSKASWLSRNSEPSANTLETSSQLRANPDDNVYPNNPYNRHANRN